MDIIFREIREMGISLVLLDQHPSKISLSALGNTNCTIAMNLKHKSDINAMAQCMLLDKDKDSLGSLKIGEAVVKMQGRIPRPFQITIPEFIIAKGKITDTHILQHMKDIAPALPEPDFRITNHKDNIITPEKSERETPNDAILALLHDIQKHPDSGIAERYKRLQISVRQGQKLKADMVKKQLIEECLRTTGTGRLKLIQITEKGQALLAQQEPE